jgi:hypothetical protein
MDQIGLGFEHYDALGQWRDDENGLAIDATGEIIGSDVQGPFDGAVELATKLAASRAIMDCFAATWFRFGLGRPALAEDAGSLAVISEDFASSGFVVAELLAAVTRSRAFRYQLVPDPDTSAFSQGEP